jgi:hypothetical protein
MNDRLVFLSVLLRKLVEGLCGDQTSVHESPLYDEVETMPGTRMGIRFHTVIIYD